MTNHSSNPYELHLLTLLCKEITKVRRNKSGHTYCLLASLLLPMGGILFNPISYVHLPGISAISVLHEHTTRSPPSLPCVIITL